MTIERPGAEAVPVMFVLGADAPVERGSRLSWRDIRSPVGLLALVVLLTTGGGVALTSARTAPSDPVAAAATAEVPQLAPSVVRIEATKWTARSRHGARQLLVSYRSNASGRRGTAVLARSTSGKHWVPIYTGSRLTADVLVPVGSALQGSVALSLIDAINRQSHGGYDVPATAANVALLEVWMNHEGGLWANNPLNTSLDASAYPHQFTTAGQDTGIPIYPNMSVGVAHVAATLLGNPAYSDILKVLASGSGSCIAFGTAVVQSPWASSHYGHNAASFCPSGQTTDVVAPVGGTRGGHRARGSSPASPNHAKNGSGPAAAVPTANGPAATVPTVSGGPAMRAGG